MNADTDYKAVQLLRPWRTWSVNDTPTLPAGMADEMVRQGIAKHVGAQVLEVAEARPEVETAAVPQRRKRR